SEQDHDGGGQRKRGRLEPRWRDAEIDRGFRLVPLASLVARDDAEMVLARTKIVVQRLATIAGVVPIGVLPFELGAKPYFPRELETQRGVVDFELPSQRRQTYRSIGRVILSVRDDRFDAYRRRDGVRVGSPRVDHLHGPGAAKPQPAIRGL